jgi:hypothetical protein
MFIVTGRDEYARAAADAMLTGTVFETLADAVHRRVAEVEAAKIVSFADWRGKLRPDATAEV